MHCRMKWSAYFRGVTISQVSSLKSRLCSKMPSWSFVTRLSLSSQISSDITRDQVKTVIMLFLTQIDLCHLSTHAMSKTLHFPPFIFTETGSSSFHSLSQVLPLCREQWKCLKVQLHTTTISVVVLVVHFLWLYFWGALMTTTTTTTLPCSTTIQGVIGGSAMVVIYFLGFNFACSYSLVLRENFKAKAWESTSSKNFHLDELSTRIHELIVPTLRLAPIGRMFNEFKCTLQVQEWSCVNEKS